MAGVDVDEAIGSLPLARRLLGREGLRFVGARHLRQDAALCTLHGKPVIFVRKDIGAERTQFAVAHELSEWRLVAIGYREPDREHVANAMAAALQAPRKPFRAAVAAGETLGELAHDFGVTQTCAALRIGETTGRPLAVVSPLAVRVRGEAWAWPETEQAIRKLGKARVPELERVDIQDQPRRFVLLADAA